MWNLSLRLPESLHNTVRDLAKQENVSINQFVTLALAEKVSALMAEDYIQEKAKRGSKKKFDAIMAKIPDRKPLHFDEPKTTE